MSHTSVTFLPLTSFLVEATYLRYSLLPDKENGLSKISQVMIDEIMTLPREKIGKVIGRVSDRKMSQITGLVALFLGFGQSREGLRAPASAKEWRRSRWDETNRTKNARVGRPEFSDRPTRAVLWILILFLD